MGLRQCVDSHENKRLIFLGQDPDASMHASSAWGDPEGIIYDIEFERHIELVDDPVDKLVICLDSIGETERAIADVLDISRKSVEYRKAKNRKIGQTQRGSLIKLAPTPKPSNNT